MTPTNVDLSYFLFAGLFVGVLIAFEGLRQFMFNGDRKTGTRKTRMQHLQKVMPRKTGYDLRPSKRKKQWWQSIPIYGTMPTKMRQAGMNLNPRLFISICICSAIAICLICLKAFDPVSSVAVSILAGVIIPSASLNIMRQRRVDDFAKQLPDALDLMKRGLSIGHPLSVTLNSVVENMDEPIRTEFQAVSDAIAYGADLSTAINEMAERLDQEDAHYLAASIGIQHGTGGNLAQTLGTLSKVIRRRFAMRRRIKSISSEGRLSAYILSALPVIMFLGTNFTAPTYYSGVYDDPLFVYMATVLIILLISNALILRKLVNFRI